MDRGNFQDITSTLAMLSESCRYGAQHQDKPQYRLRCAFLNESTISNDGVEDGVGSEAFLAAPNGGRTTEDNGLA
jgi:hypothetical protein